MKQYLVILTATLVFYGASLKYGFSQDDFFFLNLAQADSWREVLLFFSPFHQQSFPFYRPLGTQLYFFVFSYIAGWQRAPLLMHTGMLLVQAMNGFLVWRLLRQLGFSTRKAMLGGLMFSLSAVHFLNLFYIAATQHLLATSFSLLFLIKFLAGSYYQAAIFLALGLLAKESALWAVIPLGIVYFFNKPINGENVSKLAKGLVLPGLVIGVYAIIRLQAGITVQPEYRWRLDHRVVSTVRFYLAFLLGFFEKIPDYPINQWRQYLMDTKGWGKVVVVTAILEVGVLVFSLFKKLKRSDLRPWRKVGLSAMLMILPLTPYLGLPNHIFPHYLEWSLLGFILLVLTSLEGKWIYVFVTLFFINNYASIKTSLLLHWSPLRSSLVERYLPLIRQEICQVESDRVVVKGDQRLIKELYYAFSGMNGPRIVCDRPNLEVYYDGMQPLPSWLSEVVTVYLKESN